MGPLTKDASAAFAENHNECDGNDHERPVLGWGSETTRARSTGLVVESGYPKVPKWIEMLHFWPSVLVVLWEPSKRAPAA
jgi:hypothetical protein